MVRQNLVIWSTSAGRRSAPSSGPRRRRRRARTGRILVLLGLVRLTRAIRPRWRPLLAGTVLTATGLIFRHSLLGIGYFPGVGFLLVALFTPGEPEPGQAQLEQDLAVYSTQAERADIEATLNRYPDSVTGELRDILARQSAASASRPGLGPIRHPAVPGGG